MSKSACEGNESHDDRLRNTCEKGEPKSQCLQEKEDHACNLQLRRDEKRKLQQLLWKGKEYQGAVEHKTPARSTKDQHKHEWKMQQSPSADKGKDDLRRGGSKLCIFNIG